MNPPVHGGPDALGVPRWDFSTNANACGPCPPALAAVQAADASRYPDPRYTALRAELAGFHAVAPARVLLAASASECIHRFSAWMALQGARRVAVPEHAYGEYAHAAQAWGLTLGQGQDALGWADLVWACEPSSPLGGAQALWPPTLVSDESALQPTVVLDCAYAPLRLSGSPTLDGAQLQRVWQLFSPNKALGLTGVRAAYAIAPLGGEYAVAELDALAPSWVLGAHGVALLQAWTQPAVQAWLAHSRATLRTWKTRQIESLTRLGWVCHPSDANFFCAQPLLVPTLDWTDWLSQLRQQGIKLRDATSFGLPGWVRLGVLGPRAQDALVHVLKTAEASGFPSWHSQGESETIQAPQIPTPVASA